MQEVNINTEQIKKDYFSSFIKQQTWKIFNKQYQLKYNKKYKQNQSFIVLASVGIIYQNHNINILTIGFGTKSLPYKLAKQNQGKLIKDMHAQVLAIKLFRKWLLNNLPLKNQSNQLFQWDHKRQKHSFKKQKYKLFLYSSQPFCGDCSIQQSSNLFSGAKPLTNFQDNKYQQKKFEKHVLRTKPGRLDLPIQKRSLSLSCSDKIGLWNILGIQGKYLFNLITPIYINQIIISTNSKFQEERIKNGIDLVYRLSYLKKYQKTLIQRKIFNIVIKGQQKKISYQFKLNQPKIRLIKDFKDNNQKHQNLETKQKLGAEFVGIIIINKISQNKYLQQVQWITGKTGLKQGRNVKKYNPQKDCSCISTYKLYKSFEMNQKIFQYKAIKARIKKLFGVWTDNFKDNQQQNQLQKQK